MCFRENIEKARNEVAKNVTIDRYKLSQAQLLNLILYYIEKEHHFTGNGVWPTSDESTSKA